MEDTVRNLAIDWQDWASTQSLGHGDIAKWTEAIEQLAKVADHTGELVEELKENGVL